MSPAARALAPNAETAAMNGSGGRTIERKRLLGDNIRAIRAGEGRFTDVAERSDGGGRHDDMRSPAGVAGFGAKRHDVSQRGCARRVGGVRGQTPISTMRPPQVGHRSMR